MRQIKDLTFFEKRLLICIKNGWYQKFNSLRKDIFDFSNIDFSKITIKLNLEKFDFSGSDFSESDFSRSDFSRSDFRDSDFRGSDFRGSDFRGSDFRESNFRGSDFSESNFNRSDFSESNFNRSDFSESNFNRSDFRGLDFRGSDFSEVNFSCQKGLSVISISGVGSNNRMTNYFYKQNKIFCGCFTGTLEEFEKKIKDTYSPEELHFQQYKIAVKYFKSQKKLMDKKQ